MDNAKENESIVGMRAIVSNWLASENWNITQLMDWLQGYDLPAMGHGEEPYLWLLRGVPEADERHFAEKKVASRVAVLLREQPDVKRPGRRPDQALYNLFMFCAGLSCSEELADPLFEVLGRRRLQGKWRGIDLRTTLKTALISNQEDSRLWSVWEDALLDGEQPFLTIDEYELIDAVRLMPPAADKRGEPALDLIGKALKMVAERKGHEEAREKIFVSLVKKVMDTYPGRPLWGRDLLVQAVKQRWPKWAIVIIPSNSPEYVVRIIRSVRQSPDIHERSVTGVIVHGFAETALLEQQSNGQSIQEAYRISLRSLAVGA